MMVVNLKNGRVRRRRQRINGRFTSDRMDVLCSLEINTLYSKVKHLQVNQRIQLDAIQRLSERLSAAEEIEG